MRASETLVSVAEKALALVLDVEELRDEDEVRIVVFRERRRILRRLLQGLNRHHTELRRTLEQSLQAVESRRDFLARLNEREVIWQ